jgi:hypothetical protein
MATRLDPASFAQAIMLDAADIPPHMTIAQWRSQRQATRAAGSGRRWRRRRLRSLRRQLLPGPAAPYAPRQLRHHV